MGTNKGILKEDEMVIHLNNKTPKELTNNCRNLMKDLFGALDEEKIIKCQKTEGSVKPDYIIEYDGKKHCVSMKSGRSQIVHQEIIKNFVLFLRSLGVSKRTQQTILYYQYGDGTMDGSAKERMSYERLRLVLADRIKEANDELNKDKDFIWKIVERCVFIGAVQDAPEADALYHGDYEFGMVVSKKQVKKHIYRKTWDYLNNLHIGPLHIRPSARYIGREIVSEKRRQRVELFWPNLKDDIDYIARRYDN